MAYTHSMNNLNSTTGMGVLAIQICSVLFWQTFRLPIPYLIDGADTREFLLRTQSRVTAAYYNFKTLLLFFSKSTLLKNSFWNPIRVFNSLDPDIVGPVLGPSCLQRVPAEDISRQRVKSYFIFLSRDI